MTYTTVFDATNQGYTIWWFPAFGLIFVAVGAMLVFRPALMDKALPGGLQGRPREVFRYVFFGFAILWTLGTFVATFKEYLRAHYALDTGEYQVAEGQVTDFIPMPYTGHANESFCVSDACFSYSDYGATVGFHNSASHGGPIREGLDVRVEYIGNLILKLQVAQ
jgi:hypothetical protein